MKTEEIENALCFMTDDELYEVIRQALSVRIVAYYNESATDDGYPTRTAKLAVMKQICCA